MPIEWIAIYKLNVLIRYQFSIGVNWNEPNLKIIQKENRLNWIQLNRFSCQLKFDYMT